MHHSMNPKSYSKRIIIYQNLILKAYQNVYVKNIPCYIKANEDLEKFFLWIRYSILLEEMCKQMGIKHFIHAIHSNTFIFMEYIIKHSQNFFRVVKISQILSYDIFFLVHTKDVNSLFNNFVFVSVSSTGSMSTYI